MSLYAGLDDGARPASSTAATPAVDATAAPNATETGGVKVAGVSDSARFYDALNRNSQISAAPVLYQQGTSAETEIEGELAEEDGNKAINLMFQPRTVPRGRRKRTNQLPRSKPPDPNPWEAEYDPEKPNSYAEYKESDEYQAMQRAYKAFLGLDVDQVSGEAKTNAFAARLMTKLGWEEGKGLGRDASGITHALNVQRTHAGHGRIIDHNRAAGSKQSPRTVVLHGLQMTDEDVQDIGDECARYGSIQRVTIGSENEIHIEFEEASAAARALQALDGLVIDQRTIKARFDD